MILSLSYGYPDSAASHFSIHNLKDNIKTISWRESK